MDKDKDQNEEATPSDDTTSEWSEEILERARERIETSEENPMHSEPSQGTEATSSFAGQLSVDEETRPSEPTVEIEDEDFDFGVSLHDNIKKPERKTEKTYTVAIAYNKGAYQVISPKDIKDIGK